MKIYKVRGEPPAPSEGADLVRKSRRTSRRTKPDLRIGRRAQSGFPPKRNGIQGPWGMHRRRKKVGSLLLAILAGLIVIGLGWYLLYPELSTTAERSSSDSAENTNGVPPAASESPAPQREEMVVPSDPTLYLTVPRLGLYGHIVRNDSSEWALGLGAIKLPQTDFPWQKGDTNTYIACHRLGYPGTQSYNQCLNLPAIQKGDEIDLTDTMGRIYRYQVSEILQVAPTDIWVTKPVEGRDIVSLQTCIERPGDLWTLGPNWTERFIVRADRVN